MFMRTSSRSRIVLCILFLAIVAYTVRKLDALDAEDALLRSLFSPAGGQLTVQGNTSSSTLELIPRIIHQTFKSSIIPDEWRAPHNTCLIHNPQGKWLHILWTDATARNFIRDTYPSFLPTYDGYPYNIQRVDSFRYFVLYHYGGIYLDLDVGCEKDLSPLLTQHAFFAKTEPHGVSNDVMGVERGHPVFDRLVSSLKENNYRRGSKYPTVMMSTGPMFVTKLVLDFLKARTHDKFTGSRRSQDHESMVSILPPELYSSSPHSYFRHYRGSTWHSWDARVILAINRSPVLFALGIFFSCSTCTLMKALRRRYCAAVSAEAQGKTGYGTS
ncbi:hypothetical protein E4U42_005073 [Claviceps africana]|uniref:Uncharacterized protein n=1 Tax=Claviceps africana TaxID=83212 RepID=A0A8K0J576_9HYPO|nr:hypothetical protein E4U42_005073 [Claviceps africana]